MERAEIIKALECCSGIAKCIECPYMEIEGCAKQNTRDAIALIKELQAHNENLKKENKYLRERLAEEAEIKEDLSVSELKAEIERLNKEVDKRVPKLIITKKPKGAGNV